MSLKNFLQKICNYIQTLFGDLPDEIKKAVKIGVLLTENIKNFVDSPTADILTIIIPENIDNIIKDKLRMFLPVLLCELKLVESSLNLTQPDDVVKTALKTMQTLGKNIKPGILHHLSVLIAQVVSDGKLSWSDGVYLSQWYYNHEL